MEPPPMRDDVAADDGSWFGLGEMSERECWGRDEGEGYFGLKGSVHSSKTQKTKPALKKMDLCSRKTVVFLVLAFAFASKGYAQDAAPLVPAIISFGDSSVDVGNNNHLLTYFKANYPPYGRDFINHQPTGRFCDGKLVTDFTADTLGFKTYAPAYLSPQATRKNLLIGANFASAGSGYDGNTSIINYYREYQSKLAKLAGRKQSASIIKDAIYIVGAGSGDFLQNYYAKPSLNKVYTPEQYSSMLVKSFSSFIKVNSSASNLQKQLPGLKIVIFDIFKPLFELVQSPSKFGFVEATRSCCGTGTTKRTVFLCNQKSARTCPNASQYVFWDSVHPSEAANKVIADEMIVQGFALI
ncbi:GDSL esterase/lipase APG [Citrus sinensis]|nr:GDSL esterase/lipase APG [Citrus sinensis]